MLCLEWRGETQHPDTAWIMLRIDLDHPTATISTPPFNPRAVADVDR
jgi:hypothetical protein